VAAQELQTGRGLFIIIFVSENRQKGF